MKTSKVLLYIAIAAFICFGLIPFIVNCLFKWSAPVALLKAEWDADEALGYVSGMLSFIGAVFLGWVSWKQNWDLLKKQDDTFIVENACTVLLGDVNFEIGQQNACNLPIHPETIACSDNLTENVYD